MYSQVGNDVAEEDVLKKDCNIFQRRAQTQV